MSIASIEKLADVTCVADLANRANELRCRIFKGTEALEIWYRGHARSCCTLVPSVFRKYEDREQALAAKFRCRAPAFCHYCPDYNDHDS